jgi:hypothetical protein
MTEYSTPLPSHTIEAIRRLHVAVHMVIMRDAMDKENLSDMKSRKRNRSWVRDLANTVAFLLVMASTTA